MSVQEFEAEALRLSLSEREELVRRLLAGLSETKGVDPILGLGTDPVICGVTDASVQHDRYLDTAAS
jgi:hypothetical protein